MSDFMEQARAEAERRWETYSDAASGADVFDKPSLVVGFLGGARWARDVLLADPTEAEIERVADTLIGSMPRQWHEGADEYYQRCARSAIAAFLAERRGSE